MRDDVVDVFDPDVLALWMVPVGGEVEGEGYGTDGEEGEGGAVVEEGDCVGLGVSGSIESRGGGKRGKGDGRKGHTHSTLGTEIEAVLPIEDRESFDPYLTTHA